MAKQPDKRAWRRWAVVTVVLLLAGCPYPRDPEGTFESVRGGTLRVGVMDSPPWVVRTDAGPQGVEVALVERMARELGAKPRWTWGSADNHMRALEHYQLDLVIGGLTRDNPWRGPVAFTRPYLKVPLVVTVRSDRPLKSISGMKVGHRPDSVAAHHIKAHGGVPVPVADPASFPGPVALPAWQARRYGRALTDVVLHKEHHVFAVPPGENRWLVWAERFLHRNKGRAQKVLEAPL